MTVIYSGACPLVSIKQSFDNKGRDENNFKDTNKHCPLLPKTNAPHELLDSISFTIFLNNYTIYYLSNFESFCANRRNVVGARLRMLLQFENRDDISPL